MWHDKSFDKHLTNKDIFIAIPLNSPKFLMGDIIPSYSIIKHEIHSSFVEIDWLWPRDCHELYFCNWDLKTPMKNLKPIVDNWYNCRAIVSNLLTVNLDKTTQALVKANAKADVCFSFLVLFKY